MGIYSSIASTVKPIDQIRTFIGGVVTDITSGWVFVNGVRKQVFPTTEVWTEVYNNNTPGNYSKTLDFGHYKVVISGAGGGGAMAFDELSVFTTDANDGSRGEQREIYIDVAENSTKTVSGKIGAAGSAGHVKLKTETADAGSGGTGYANGAAGGSKQASSQGRQVACVGGAGGGSTNVSVDGANYIAKGGNGGSANYRYSTNIVVASGGTGGSGGTTSGSGATGGSKKKNSNANENTDYYSNTGSNGYVRIYKSNIYPN